MIFTSPIHMLLTIAISAYTYWNLKRSEGLRSTSTNRLLTLLTMFLVCSDVFEIALSSVVLYLGTDRQSEEWGRVVYNALTLPIHVYLYWLVTKDEA